MSAINWPRANGRAARTGAAMMLFSVAFLAGTGGAAPKSPKSEVWIYTSIYKEFAAPIEAAFEAKYPDIDAQVFQAGSEKIQAKVEAELIAKKPQADIILTSDPFWSIDLARRGLAAKRADRDAVETNYNSLMVITVHKNLPAAQRPRSFADLTKPEFKNLLQTGSPLESGTVFSAVAYLSKKYGWEYFEKLRANNLAAAGGNSTVIQKLESGEKKVGVALLENVLAAQKRGSPLEVIYPEDGAIPIPSVQVILRDAKHQDNAAKFADFILSEEGQKLLLAGHMYPVHKSVPGPAGAKPLAEVTKNSLPWTPAWQQEIADSAKDIKKKFAQLILE